MLKKHLGYRTIFFLFVYCVAFLFSLGSVAITCDEYEGGNASAEFGTQLFDYFMFPVGTLWDYYWQGAYHSGNTFLILFVISLIVNFLLYLFILEMVFQQIMKLVQCSMRNKAKS